MAQQEQGSSKKALAVAFTATLLLATSGVGYLTYSSTLPTELSSLHEARRLYSYAWQHKAAKMEAYEPRLRGQDSPRARMEGQALPTYSTTSTVTQSSTVKRIGMDAKMEAKHHTRAAHEPRMEGQTLPTYSTSGTITQSSTVKRIGSAAKMEAEYHSKAAHEPRMEGQTLPTYSTSGTVTQSSTVKRIGSAAAKMEGLPPSYTYGGRISGHGESISTIEAKAQQHKKHAQHHVHH